MTSWKLKSATITSLGMTSLRTSLRRFVSVKTLLRISLTAVVVCTIYLFDCSIKTTTAGIRTLDSRERNYSVLFDFLDHVSIVKSVPNTEYSGRLPSATIHAPREEDTREEFVWQPVGPGNHTYVFSAHLDPRTNPASVVIIGISSDYDARSRRWTSSEWNQYCYLWYKGDPRPDVSDARYSYVQETHGLKYAVSFHICYEQRRRDHAPYAVSLVNQVSELPTNVLKVLKNDLTSPEVNFTVCFAPVFDNYNNYKQLVETVETNRMFGAQRFVFYNISGGNSVSRHIEEYVREDLAYVIPWSSPTQDVHCNGQVAAVNDCLYRNMFRSRFIVFSDLDEFIVPRQQDTWTDMLENLSRDHMKKHWNSIWRWKTFPGTYLIRNSFFQPLLCDQMRVNESDSRLLQEAKKLEVASLLRVRREKMVWNFNERSKYMVWPKLSSVAGIHFLFNSIDSWKVGVVEVDTEQALLQHYRDSWNHGCGNESVDVTTLVSDPRMLKYSQEMLTRVKTRRNKVDTN